ncbi:hypothetical protein [Kutzneria buriramensis]|uniref:Uncharacterized protein n=1 Tax=Kutzneria buriramensis TaxID=1045776 RepID=A0A3E0I9F1_9PSEU|nr:hypothetical protein [Kutzneria buriramensis]REH55186.1 hypothetical protein BCF44_101203 [Kutzneria buriramensis]
MNVQINVDIPPEIEAGINTGDLIRDCGVVRDTAGRIVALLKETSALKPDEDAVGAAARMLKKPVIAGLATLAAVGTAAAAVAIVRQRKRALPECVKNYSDSLRAYLEAVRNQSLDAEIIDRLIADLDAVKAYSEDGNITVDFSTEQSETLVHVVIAYTRQLAQANSIDLDESPESTPTSADAPVMDLRRYLEVQRRIFNDAA